MRYIKDMETSERFRLLHRQYTRMHSFDLNDFPLRTSKSELSRKFGLTRRSLHNYHSVAIAFCDEFDEDYPKLKGVPFRESPLTQYQCWVLWGIYQFIRIEGLHKKVLEEYLLEDVSFQAKFSKKAFERIYPKYNEETIYESQELCRVA